jgi:hypothetical protein
MSGGTLRKITRLYSCMSNQACRISRGGACCWCLVLVCTVRRPGVRSVHVGVRSTRTHGRALGAPVPGQWAGVWWVRRPNSPCTGGRGQPKGSEHRGQLASSRHRPLKFLPEKTMSSTRAVLLLLAAAHPAAAVRQSLTFDYGWKFKLGDPETASPPLQAASMDPTFTNISSGYSCTQLAWSQLGRMAPRDCTGACSATPGCKAWMWAQKWPSNLANTRGCFIHDGTLGDDPVCTPTTVDPEVGPASGGMRKTVPPPIQERKGVSWKEAGFDDSQWRSVDVPHATTRTPS